ncbi:MAG: hypothetical protein ACI8Y3_000863 [Paraglaciecola sp.]|jgi:hypothetical protein
MVLTILFATKGDGRGILVFTQAATKLASRDMIFYVSWCDNAELIDVYFKPKK